MDLLYVAWRQVKKNGGGAGIDNVPLKSFCSEEKVTQLLISIQRELREKTYRSQPVKRVYIPKSTGKLRPLGVPTVKDRVVQAAVKLLLEPIFEQDFLDCSYGFRPNRSAHEALEQIRASLMNGKKAVYDVDLKGYFDSIPHDKLMACIKMRVVDRSILNLIKMWLKAPIAEETHKGRGPKITYPKEGTPQGGVISPLLANLYLHWFDKVFHASDGPVNWAKATLVRYADDFVILARSQSDRLINFVEEKIENWLGLVINREKTKVVEISKQREKFNFLGYTYSYKADLKGRSHRYLCMEPSKEAIQSAKDSVNNILGTYKGCVPICNLIAEVNRFLEGWGNYFSIGYDRMAKRKLNHHVYQRLIKHIKRRSQRPYRPPEGTSYYAECRKLGLKYQ
jgi:RNA-directed DNA polymerase